MSTSSSSPASQVPTPSPPTVPLYTNYILDTSLRTRFQLTKLEGEAICTELSIAKKQIDELIKAVEGMGVVDGGGLNSGGSGSGSKSNDDWGVKGVVEELKRMEREVREKTGRMGEVMEGMDGLEVEVEVWLRNQSRLRNYRPR
ncbi:hypothetical protein TWF718_000638 [Orbilia javanica]|uniref:Uncharacterized protein n=1 Tax=Orbilia javanica TaxID=47235 RepID=A0AAN8NFR2_9PEZI